MFALYSSDPGNCWIWKCFGEDLFRQNCIDSFYTDWCDINFFVADFFHAIDVTKLSIRRGSFVTVIFRKARTNNKGKSFENSNRVFIFENALPSIRERKAIRKTASI